MNVSKRYIAASSALILFAAAPAFAQECCKTGAFTGGITNIPVVSGANNGCCGTISNQVIGVPGVTVPGSNLGVNIGGNNIGGNTYNIGGSTFGGTNVNVGGNSFYSGGGGVFYGGGFSGGGSYYSGGGGFYNMPAGTNPGMIELNVGGAGGQAQAAMETISEQKTITEIVPIRAVCMDDRGTPHPASRPNADEQVAATFDGEVYRCMAGTHMEVTVGKMVDGKAVFDGGTALSCQKGQALSYKGGKMICTAQITQRNCNERSLLRRFGPGIKYVTLTRIQTVQTQRQSQSQSQQAMTFRSSMFVDGGVGQGVY